MLNHAPRLVTPLLLAAACTWLGPHEAAAQGVYAPGVGAINRSMGSAAAGAPVDGMGALNWNPATISGLRDSELSFSIEALIPDIDAASFVPGLGGGSTSSESGACILPNIAWVHKTPGERLTIGLGVLSVAGFMTNYPADPTNPILAPQRSPAAPLGGLGRVYSEAMFVDIAPTISYALSDRLSVGFAPVATMSKLEVEPMVFAGVNDADGDNFSTYPTGQGARNTWGGGANLGLYYTPSCHWGFGLGVKTPRWMEDYRYNTEDELGNPLLAEFDWDLPMVVSLGGSYAGLQDTLLAVDLRYIDYDNANGFGDSGVDAAGALRGLGWESVFAIACGMQRQLSDTLVGRVGYVYNENPIPDVQTMFNIAAPLHYEHTFSGGLSYQPNRCLSLNMSYSYALQSEISGPIVLPPNPPTATPPTPVPGSSVTSTLSAHALDFGVTVKY